MASQRAGVKIGCHSESWKRVSIASQHIGLCHYEEKLFYVYNNRPNSAT